MKQFYSFILITVIALGATGVSAQTYTLDLSSSFTSPWSSGNSSGIANNIGGSGVNCTISMAFTGTGSFDGNYPRVNGNSDFVVQGSTDAMEVDINLGNKTSYLTITYTFSKAIQNVSFGISDIDRPDDSSPWAYVDKVTVSGTGPTGTVLPTLTKYNGSSNIFNIADNVATANTGNSGGSVSSTSQNSSAQNGTMFINFDGNAVTTITVQYTTLNSSSVSSNPGLQAIAFGNISFKKSVAPVTTNVSSATMSSSSSATAVSALNGTDDESVVSYNIVAIPSVASGVLLYHNGITYVAVTAGQSLTLAQAASLRFDPAGAFNGNASFTFTATDNRGVASNTSTFTIPVTSTLPVILSAFTAAWNGNRVALNWSTAQESNSAYFVVEKSNDGYNNWQPVATVTAAGNSASTRNYSAIDAQPYAITYYRIKQVDKDGSFIYSKVVKLEKQETMATSIKIYPNPVTATATIITGSNSNEPATVKLYNSNGIMVKKWQVQLVNGNNNINIPLVSALANGMYIATIENSNTRLGSVQFVKQ
jgi:hypothetical protein